MTPSTPLDYALDYAALGWRVFPVNRDKTPLTTNGFKDASIDPVQIRSWWEKRPDAGIGVATGRESGIVVLDVDLEKEGAAESLRTLLQTRGKLPEDVVCRTGGGGYHLYFKHPEAENVPNAQRLFGLTGIDVRGDGGYVVVPPSSHVSGNQYEWGDGQSPFIATLPECPEFLYGAKRNRKSFQFSDSIVEGERNATLASIAGLLRSLGLEQSEILLVLRSQNEARCNPPLPDAEVETIAFHMSKFPPHPNRGGDSDVPSFVLNNLLLYDQTDKGFGEMIGLVLTGRVKFDHTLGKWLLWRKHWWEIDTREEILQRVYEVSDMYGEAVKLIDDPERRAMCLKYTKSIQNLSKVTPALTVARSLPQISTTHNDWDRDLDIMGVANGVLELKTGKLRDGFPQDYILRHSAVPYDPDAQCPRWMKFLDEVFEGKQEVIDFVQAAVGYSLTGRTTEQCLFLLVGDGSNGKSIFLETIYRVSNQYGYAAPFSTFVRSFGPQSNSNDIAALNGRRLVTASETNEGTSLDESRIKSLTGGQVISARFLNREFFEFMPICKIWLGVNHLPRVYDDSDGFWRRVRRIDFPVKFTGSRRDPDLLDKLEKELPGILAWASRGAKRWYEHGLKTPKAVEVSTSNYRTDSDPLHVFLETHCDQGEELTVSVDDLFRAYIADGRQKMMKIYELLNSTRFHSRISRDYAKVTFNGRRMYKGLRLKESSTEILFPSSGTITIKHSTPTS